MKTTTKPAAKKTKKTDWAAIDNALLDAAMTESDRAYWAEAERIEKSK